MRLTYTVSPSRIALQFLLVAIVLGTPAESSEAQVGEQGVPAHATGPAEVKQGAADFLAAGAAEALPAVAEGVPVEVKEGATNSAASATAAQPAVAEGQGIEGQEVPSDIKEGAPDSATGTAEDPTQEAELSAAEGSLKDGSRPVASGAPDVQGSSSGPEVCTPYKIPCHFIIWARCP